MLRLLFAITLFGFAPAVHAASFTAETAVAHALRHNPDLIAARHRISEAEGRLMHAGRLASPEIEAELLPNLEGREFSAGLGVVQKIPLTQRLRLEKNVSQAELAVARLEVREAERLLELQVRTLAVKLLDLQARRGLQRRRAEHSRELAAAANRAAATGEGSALAAAEFELETGEVEAKLLQIDAEEVSLSGGLRPLLGLPPSGRLAITGPLAEPVAPNGLSVPEVTQRAGYLAARARSEAARQNLALQHASKWEDITVGLGYEREHSEDAGYGLRRENFIGLKVSVPLPLGKNNLSHIREAEAAAKRREAEADALAAGLRAEAAAARAEMLAAAKVHDQTSGALLGKARQLEERFLAAYQSGQAPLTDVLRSREKRLALEAASLDARRDYNLARVRFEAAMGR
jgi:outer membrane protein, heavy metal efflux system